MDRPVFKVVIFSECVVLISGIGMAPPSGMGGSETSEYSPILRDFMIFIDKDQIIDLVGVFCIHVLSV